MDFVVQFRDFGNGSYGVFINDVKNNFYDGLMITKKEFDHAEKTMNSLTSKKLFSAAVVGISFSQPGKRSAFRFSSENLFSSFLFVRKSKSKANGTFAISKTARSCVVFPTPQSATNMWLKFKIFLTRAPKLKMNFTRVR